MKNKFNIGEEVCYINPNYCGYGLSKGRITEIKLTQYDVQSHILEDSGYWIEWIPEEKIDRTAKRFIQRLIDEENQYHTERLEHIEELKKNWL